MFQRTGIKVEIKYKHVLTRGCISCAKTPLSVGNMTGSGELVWLPSAYPPSTLGGRVEELMGMVGDSSSRPEQSCFPVARARV